MSPFGSDVTYKDIKRCALFPPMGLLIFVVSVMNSTLIVNAKQVCILKINDTR